MNRIKRRFIKQFLILVTVSAVFGLSGAATSPKMRKGMYCFAIGFALLLLLLPLKVWSATTYTFITIDFPDAVGTTVNGIDNSGNIVGTYNYYAGPFIDYSGFLKDGGGYSSIHISGSYETYASDINNYGDIIGRYDDSLGYYHGFLKNSSGISYIDAPGATERTYLNGINDSGVIVGSSLDIWHWQSGFIIDSGGFSSIGFPGAVSHFGTRPEDINNNGVIVGTYSPYDGDGAGFHGFIKDSGGFSSFDFPGASETRAYGINDSGVIIGSYIDTSGTQGFIKDSGGFSSIIFPGASSTSAYGINDSGVIVGSYTDNTGTHGFVATPIVPEPISSILFVTGGTLLMWRIYSRRKA